MANQEYKPDGGTAPGEGSSSATSNPFEGQLQGSRQAHTQHADQGVTRTDTPDGEALPGTGKRPSTGEIGGHNVGVEQREP